MSPVPCKGGGGQIFLGEIKATETRALQTPFPAAKRKHMPTSWVCE